MAAVRGVRDRAQEHAGQAEACPRTAAIAALRGSGHRALTPKSPYKDDPRKLALMAKINNSETALAPVG